MLCGLCAMSGASTLFTLLCCGQVTVAVVWLTGRNGARIKRTMPRKPVMAAVRRAALRFQKPDTRSCDVFCDALCGVHCDVRCVVFCDAWRCVWPCVRRCDVWCDVWREV